LVRRHRRPHFIAQVVQKLLGKASNDRELDRTFI
jgi:hypothetical protein